MFSNTKRARAVARLSVTALIVGVLLLGLLPAAGAQVAGVAPAANPAFPGTCGLDIAVVLDTSASITSTSQGGDPGNPDIMKAAAKQLVTSLTGTPSAVGVYSFRTAARTEVGITDIRTASGVATVAAAIDGVDFSTNNPASFPPGTPYPSASAQATIGDRYGTIGGTNWQDGFNVVAGDGADVVIFITDGNPTTWSGDATQTPPDPGFVPGEQEDLDAGVTAANAVKAQGTRVIAVGIGTTGSLVSFNPANLTLISGPTLDDDYYLITDFGLLDDTLDSIALRLCAPSVSVVKYIDTANGPVPAAGWEFTARLSPAPAVVPAPAVTDAGGSVNFKWSADGDTTVNLTETLKPGFRFVGASCKDRFGAPWPVTASGNGIDLTVGLENFITCEFHNEALPASITLEKTPSVGVARVGDTVTYTYKVTNTGGVTLTGLSLSDDKLGPITLATTTLAVGASTTGTATTTITSAVLPGPVVNVAKVTGTAPDGGSVTATDTETVALAGIAITKVPSRATATVGDLITYTYTITNTGGVALDTVGLTDDKLGTLTVAATTLAPGAKTTATATHTVTAADGAGPIVNVATVTATITTPDRITGKRERVTAMTTATVPLTTVLAETVTTTTTTTPLLEVLPKTGEDTGGIALLGGGLLLLGSLALVATRRRTDAGNDVTG